MEYKAPTEDGPASADDIGNRASNEGAYQSTNGELAGAVSAKQLFNRVRP
jgi:hypothetical protein